MTGIAAALATQSVLGVVTLNPDTYTNTVVDPTDATASFTLGSNGAVSSVGTASNGWSAYNWLTGDLASNYEARMTGGAFAGSALATWLSLGTNRTWSKTRTTIGANSGSGTLEIRKIGTTNVLATATIALSAEVTA